MLAMKMSAGTAALAVSSACHADWVTWDIRYAKPVIGPGESQTIEVWVEFAKYASVGTTVYPAGVPLNIEVLAPYGHLVKTAFNLVNAGNGETGRFGEQTRNPKLWAAFKGEPTPENDMKGMVFWGGIPPSGDEFRYNPGWLWSVTWKPHEYAPREVTFETEAGVTGTGASLSVYSGFNHSTAGKANWVPISDRESFKVVPSPSVAASGLVAGFFMSRRRRASGPV